MRGLNPKSNSQKKREPRKLSGLDKHEDNWKEIYPDRFELFKKSTVRDNCPNRPTCGFCLKHSECIDDYEEKNGLIELGNILRR
jgi:hypothetical protein